MTEALGWPLLLQAFATFAMTGLIWFVQVVHYPLLGRVGVEGYGAYQEAHMRLTTWVVGPLMLLEAVTAVWIVVDRPRGLGGTLAWGGLALLAVIWLATAFLAVPRHETLRHAFNSRAHSALVASNWVRTAAWSARSVLLLATLQAASL